MLFDILSLILVILAFIKGYNKGFVSGMLRLGVFAGAFLLVLYINSQMLIIPTPYGMWGQGVILYLVIVMLSNTVIKFIDFEEILLLGFISRILGAILQAVIATTILVFVSALLLRVGGEQFIQETAFFDGSMLLERVRSLLVEFPLDSYIKI